MTSRLFLISMVLEVLVLVGLMVKDGWQDAHLLQTRINNKELVEALMITDLAIWTEARYTRHPTQADLFTAFQESPSALDHFPSGTWVSYPLRKGLNPAN